MKKTVIMILSLLVFVSAKITKAQSAVGVGLRHQIKHSVFKDYPFEDGDLTYTLGYEYHDQNGYWQMLVGYTPEVGKGDLVDYIITPQLNLIIQDEVYLAGVGALGSYVESKDNGGDWTSVYWQMMLGLEIPLGPVKLEILAYYPFESWGDLSDFKFNDIEYGGSLKYYF